jgi:hypothetical protein
MPQLSTNVQSQLLPKRVRIKKTLLKESMTLGNETLATLNVIEIWDILRLRKLGLLVKVWVKICG